MELRRYLRLIRQRLALVIVAVIVGGITGFVTTSRAPIYTASATIYVGSVNLGVNQVQLYAEAGLNEVVATFAEMIPSPVIAQKAIEHTHINRFAGELPASTTATVVLGTNLIDVAVSDHNSHDAITLVNAVSHAFVSQISNYQGTGTATQGQVPNEPAYVFQEAIAATPNATGALKKTLVGALFGLVISVLLILLLDYLDITIKSPEELERRVDLPVLGIIPHFNSLQRNNSPNGALERPAIRKSNG